MSIEAERRQRSNHHTRVLTGMACAISNLVDVYDRLRDHDEIDPEALRRIGAELVGIAEMVEAEQSRSAQQPRPALRVVR